MYRSGPASVAVASGVTNCYGIELGLQNKDCITCVHKHEASLRLWIALERFYTSRFSSSGSILQF